MSEASGNTGSGERGAEIHANSEERAASESSSAQLPVSSDSGLRVNVYALMAECVEEGAGWAVARAFKYAPSKVVAWVDANREQIEEQIEREVMNAICERFLFPDPGGE